MQEAASWRMIVLRSSIAACKSLSGVWKGKRRWSAPVGEGHEGKHADGHVTGIGGRGINILQVEPGLLDKAQCLY